MWLNEAADYVCDDDCDQYTDTAEYSIKRIQGSERMNQTIKTLDDKLMREIQWIANAADKTEQTREKGDFRFEQKDEPN